MPLVTYVRGLVIKFCVLSLASVCVLDTFVFETWVESDKNMLFLCVRDWVVKDASWCLRNRKEQPNPSLSVIISKARCCSIYIFVFIFVCKSKRSIHQSYGNGKPYLRVYIHKLVQTRLPRDQRQTKPALITPYAIIVVYGILIGGMHPICTYYRFIHVFPSFVSVNASKSF